MAAILVPEDQQGKVKNVTCYDPSAGSGTLLMNLAHAIGEDRCTIFSPGYFAKILQPAAAEPDPEQSGAFHPEHHSGQHLAAPLP